MSYSASIDEHDYGQVASNFGWGEFTRWVETLDAKYQHLHHVSERMWSKDPKRIARELREALKASPPKNQFVEATAKHFLEILDRAPASSEAIAITG